MCRSTPLSLSACWIAPTSDGRLRSTYSWVPQQSWDKTWTDELLYEKYGITKGEISFINSMIRPMGESDD